MALGYTSHSLPSQGHQTYETLCKPNKNEKQAKSCPSSKRATDSHQTFTAENGGTRFQVRAELHPQGMARLFGWFIVKLILERHFETAVQELKEELEKA